MKNLLKPKWFKKYFKIYKESGFKAVFKKGGVKLIIAFFLFYLIRDSILYLLPLFLAFHGVQSCN